MLEKIKTRKVSIFLNTSRLYSVYILVLVDLFSDLFIALSTVILELIYLVFYKTNI